MRAWQSAKGQSTAVHQAFSQVHKAAAGRIHAERGLGLRFPRFLRVRPDKTVEEASTADILTDLYNKQTRRSGAQKQALSH